MTLAFVIFFTVLQGTGKDQTSLSDWVVSMKLVDGNGDIRSLPGDIGSSSVSPDDVMKAAQANLGLYGVILEFTIKVQPMSNCQVKNIFTQKVEV